MDRSVQLRQVPDRVCVVSHHGGRYVVSLIGTEHGLQVVCTDAQKMWLRTYTPRDLDPLVCCKMP